MELFERLGFKKNPFSTFSAEQERDFLDKVFIEPRNYKSLKSDIINNNSRFIIGARGIGKTALILKLKNEIETENVFCVLLDVFDGIPVKDNKAEFLKHIIEQTIKTFCVSLSSTPQLLKNLNKSDKEKLGFIIAEFFYSLSKSELEGFYNKATKYKTRNILRNVYNKFFNKPINLLIAGGVEIISDSIRKSLGLPQADFSGQYKDYLPELKLEDIQKETNRSKLLNSNSLKRIFEDLAILINKSGFKSTCILFDRADEYTELGFGIDSVCLFLKDLLSDTSLLLNSNYSFVIGIWDALKTTLDSYKVRFDKIKPFDINWDSRLLNEILNKRVGHFSSYRISTNDIFTPKSILTIIDLSNKSPRYMFRQLSVIYDEQNNLDETVTSFSEEIVDSGQLMYCKDFEFYAVFPSKKGGKEDIIININRILKIGSYTIKTKDFVNLAKVSTPTAINYIKMLQDYGLVKYIGETEKGAKTYEIQNPIIKNLIEKGIKEIRT